MAQKTFKSKSIQPMNPNDLAVSPELEEVQSYFPISSDDRERLKKDIQESGEIRDPIKVYYDHKDNCLILGGKNRWEIARELGWQYVPIEVFDLKPRERRELALMDNLARRHMNADQKRRVIEMFLKNDPVQSNRIIAKKTGSDHKTVSKARKTLESTGEIPQLKKTKGADGKVRKADPAPKPSKKSTGEIPQFRGAADVKKAPESKTKVQVRRDRSFEKGILDQISAYAKQLSFGDREVFKNDLLTFVKRKV